MLVALGGAVVGGFRPLLRRGVRAGRKSVWTPSRGRVAVGVTILVLSIVWVVHDRMLRARRQVP